MANFLDSLYRTDLSDRVYFQDHWCGPQVLGAWKWTLVAKYPKSPPRRGRSGSSRLLFRRPRPILPPCSPRLAR